MLFVVSAPCLIVSLPPQMEGSQWFHKEAIYETLFRWSRSSSLTSGLIQLRLDKETKLFVRLPFGAQFQFHFYYRRSA